MFSSDTSRYNLTTFNKNSYCGGNFDIDGLDYLDLSNVAGQSQPQYTGVDVLGDLNNYPDFVTLSPTPSQSLANGLHAYVPYFQDITIPPTLHETAAPFQVLTRSSLLPPSPIPVLSHDSLSLSPESYTGPSTPTLHVYPQATWVSGGLDFGFPAVPTSPSLHAADYTPEYDTTWGGLLPHNSVPPPDPFRLDLSPSDLIVGAIPPNISEPVPATSSSGPSRTRQPAREARRYNPTRAVKKKAESESESDGWDRTLVRFQAHLETMYNSVHNGQPSGGLLPEKALAELTVFVKEDLKRSPLRNTKAGEGKRSRNVEAYLEGLLQEIRQTDLDIIPGGGESNERKTTVDALSKLADELETRLQVVNQQPALRLSVPGKGNGQPMVAQPQWKRNQVERARRGTERNHVERISRLFRASVKPWPRKDVLCLAVLFLLRGPAAFPHGFVQARHATAAL